MVKEKKEDAKKILILTASPIRDKIVDELIAGELRKMGNEVFVNACLREGRDAVLMIKPNVVVMPPIRNPYSRDFAEQMKKWGIGVVSRHTEPSCDWQDYKEMSPVQKQNVLGRWPYFVDLELVWSEDEAQILNQRRARFRTYAIGAVTVDIYYRQDYIDKARNRKLFNSKHRFSDKKKNLLIASPWGFADSAPDLRIDETGEAKKDIEGRDRHLKMIREVYEALKDKWNILVTIHPDVLDEPYKKLCSTLKIPLDIKSPAFELRVNSDALIHSGSTMAIGAHFLKIPAYQYGDVNAKDSDNWWGMPESTISKVSPYFNEIDKLIKALKNYKQGSNANRKTIKTLAQGRYGKMDGKATKRAARLIGKVVGQFKMRWPDATRDYNQLTILQGVESILQMQLCNICKKPFAIIKNDWLQKFCKFTGCDTNKLRPPFGTCCPHCASRMYLKDDIGNNPGTAQQPAPTPQSTAGTASQ